jgi:hypothetical protein
MNHSDLMAAVDNIIELNERLIAVTKQRDGLQKIVDEQCRFSSVCCEYREQRDGLAMALQELCVALLTANPLDITELLNKAGDALQSLTNPNEP